MENYQGQTQFKNADEKSQAKVTGITLFACGGTAIAVAILVFITYCITGQLPVSYLAAFIVLELIAYGGAVYFFAKDVRDQKVNYFVLATMAILCFVSGMCFDAYYLRTLVIMPFLATILQYNVKITRMNFFIIGGLSMVIPFVKNAVPGIAYSSPAAFNENVFQSAIVAFIMATIWLCSCKLKKIQSDVIGKLKYDESLQGQILSEVMSISDSVAGEATKTNALLVELSTGADAVRDSIEEVADVAVSNTNAVEKQSIKTKEIQDSVEHTAVKTNELVAIAKDVNNEVKKGLESLDKLSKSTQTIEGVTGRVVSQMNELNNSMEEMKGFADSILSISNQTNLLALNASIESARAGEAGRGFAVVAEQIRILSDQTKNATGKISQIIEELFDRTQEVSESINESREATSNQTQLIDDVNANFNSTGEKIDVLGASVDEIQLNIADLKKANAEIVENISQISASCEELTATTQNITAIATKNGEDTNEAKNAVGRMVEETQKFDKYKK